jgi:hypothetical protein
MGVYEIRDGKAKLGPRDYHPNRNKLFQLIAAGLVATTAMVVFGFLMPALGVVGIDWAATYGAILNGGLHPEAFTPLWWAGLGWHYLNGALILPVLFDFLTDRTVLPQIRYLRGLSYAAVLWILVESIVKPLSGNGFFSADSPAPGQMMWLSLASWLVYGVCLDTMTRVRVVESMNDLTQRRDAA